MDLMNKNREGTKVKMDYISKFTKHYPHYIEAMIYATNNVKYNVGDAIIAKLPILEFQDPKGVIPEEKWEEQLKNAGIADKYPIIMGVEEWERMKKILDELSCGQTSEVASKIRDLESLAINCTYDGYVFLFKILRKDLNIGILSKNLEKIFGENVTGRFDVMLAESGYDSISFDEGYIEPKYDGVRAVIFIDKAKSLRVISRNGKNYEAYSEIIEKALSDEARKFLSLYAIDSEIIVDGEFRKSSGAGHSKYIDRELMDIQVNVFDSIELGFLNDPSNRKSGGVKFGLKDRKDSMTKNIGIFPKFFKLVPSEEFTKKPTIPQMKVLLKKYISMGFEGVMVKSKNGEYQKKRSKDWIKIKPRYSVDVRVTGYEEGKNKGELGAFVVGFDGSQVTAKVGSGFTKEQKKSFWVNREQMVGKIIEVNYQSIQDTLRFPSFVKVRDDKDETDVWEKVLKFGAERWVL